MKFGLILTLLNMVWADPDSDQVQMKCQIGMNGYTLMTEESSESNCEYCFNGSTPFEHGNDTYLGLKKCMSNAAIEEYHLDTD